MNPHPSDPAGSRSIYAQIHDTLARHHLLPLLRKAKPFLAVIVLLAAVTFGYSKLGSPSKIARYEATLHEQSEAFDALISMFDDIRARANYPGGDFYKGMEYSKRTEEYRKIIQLAPRLKSRVEVANNRLKALNEAAEPVLKRYPELEGIHRRIQPSSAAIFGLDDLSGKVDAIRCRDAIREMLSKLDEID